MPHGGRGNHPGRPTPRPHHTTGRGEATHHHPSPHHKGLGGTIGGKWGGRPNRDHIRSHAPPRHPHQGLWTRKSSLLSASSSPTDSFPNPTAQAKWMTYSGDSIGHPNVALFRLNLLDGDLEARDTLCVRDKLLRLASPISPVCSTCVPPQPQETPSCESTKKHGLPTREKSKRAHHCDHSYTIHELDVCGNLVQASC